MSSSLVQDVRIAFRGLLKTPGLTFVVVLTLAVAIGANTAIFSVVDGVLRSPLPYPDESRVVRVAATVHATDANTGGDRGNAFSDRGYWHFANNNRSFEKFGGYFPGAIQYPLTGEGAPRQVGVGLMTLSAFEVLGVTPELGRLPTAEEAAPNGPSVALLGHDLWASQYGSDPSMIGSTVQVNGISREVIGVMPAGYDFPTPQVEVWTPWQLNPASTNFGAHFIFAIARLSPGVTIEACHWRRAEPGRALRRIGLRSPVVREHLRWRCSRSPHSRRDRRRCARRAADRIRHRWIRAVDRLRQRRQPAAGSSGRAAARERRAHDARVEPSAARAARARRERAARADGGVAGVMLAHAGTSALLLMDPAGIPRLAEIEVSGAALAFTAGVAVLAGMLFGVLPALARARARRWARCATAAAARRSAATAIALATRS